MLQYNLTDKLPFELYLEHGVSTEGLADGFAFLSDMVGHAFRTIATNLTHLNADYVQSDFKQYYSRYKNRLTLFFNNPLKQLSADTFLPIPDGMIGTYPEIMAVLTPVVIQPFNRHVEDITTCIKAFIRILSKHDSDPSTWAKSFIEQTTALNLSDAIEMTHALKDSLPNYFRKGRVGHSTVGEQFQSKEDIRSITTQLLMCGDSYKEFLKHRVDIIELEKVFKLLTTVVSRMAADVDKSIKSELSKILYTFIKEIALYCDYYGAALSETLRIEHKFILCLDQCMANA